VQVLGFASRLAEAQREVADCQRALMRLQQATAVTPSTHRSYHQTDIDDNRTPRRRQRLQVLRHSLVLVLLDSDAVRYRNSAWQLYKNKAVY